MQDASRRGRAPIRMGEPDRRQRHLGAKENRPFQYGQLLARTSMMPKVQAILHDWSIALEFMTDDPSEAKESA
jgi:hypothetical protein